MSEYIWVGLDVHLESITAAILEGDAADPEVIAPSLIPRKTGDRRKTDRLDAVMLVKLYRSGHLTTVHVPTEDQEALRRLLRLRYTYQTYCKATKNRISGILLNRGFVYREGKSTWTKKHRQWLARLRQESEGPFHTALAAELEHLEYLEMQRDAFDGEIQRYAEAPPYRTPVEALCCLRGVKVLTAVTLLCEIDDVRRFRSPRALMAYFGLVPTECSSRERERKGPITKAGNVHARRVLIEAAWNNRHNASADLILKRRRQGQPPEVVAIAMKAQHRLVHKFWRLDQRKHRHVAITAVARELCGFVWAILNAAPQSQTN